MTYGPLQTDTFWQGRDAGHCRQDLQPKDAGAHGLRGWMVWVGLGYTGPIRAAVTDDFGNLVPVGRPL